MEMVKQKREKVEKLQGSLLYYYNNEACFAKGFDNCLFINEDEKVNSLSLNFNVYVLDFLSICGQVKDKPAIIYFDNNDVNMHREIHNRLGFGKDYLYFYTKNKEEGDESERLFLKNVKYHIDSNKAAFLTASREDHSELLIDIFHNRSVISPFFKQKIFIIIPNIEDFDIKHLTEFFTLCRSRQVYFIMLINDKTKFCERYSKEAFDSICCSSKIIFKNDENKSLSVTLGDFRDSTTLLVADRKQVE